MCKGRARSQGRNVLTIHYRDGNSLSTHVVVSKLENAFVYAPFPLKLLTRVCIVMRDVAVGTKTIAR